MTTGLILGSRAWHTARRAKVLELKSCASRHILRALVDGGLVVARPKGTTEEGWEAAEIDKINAIIQRARLKGRATLRPRGKDRAPAFDECMASLRAMVSGMSTEQKKALRLLIANLH